MTTVTKTWGHHVGPRDHELATGLFSLTTLVQSVSLVKEVGELCIIGTD